MAGGGQVWQTGGVSAAADGGNGTGGGGGPPMIALALLAGALGGAAWAALVAWLVLRRTMGVRAGQVKVWDRDINDNP